MPSQVTAECCHQKVECRDERNISSRLARWETGERFIVFSRGPWDDS